MVPKRILLENSPQSMITVVLVITLLVSPVIFYASTNTKSMPATANSPKQVSIGFDKNDVNLIDQTTDLSIKFLLSLQTTSGAIAESPDSNTVYTRDLALAIYCAAFGE
jgi:flagellar basal body-associated protein FliL